jgi:cobalt-zinc-cadmium efflux system membrane fusion protein
MVSFPGDVTLEANDRYVAQQPGCDSAQLLFTVANLAKLQIVADVYERDLELIHVGQVARDIAEDYPEAEFSVAVFSLAKPWIP